MTPYVYVMGPSGVGKTTLLQGLTDWWRRAGVPVQGLYIGGIWRSLAQRYPAGEETDPAILSRAVGDLDVVQAATLVHARLDGPGVSLRAAELSQNKTWFDAVGEKLNALLSDAAAARPCAFYIMEGRELILSLLPRPVLVFSLTARDEVRGCRRAAENRASAGVPRDELDASRQKRWGYHVPHDVSIVPLDTSDVSPEETRARALRFLSPVLPSLGGL